MNQSEEMKNKQVQDVLTSENIPQERELEARPAMQILILLILLFALSLAGIIFGGILLDSENNWGALLLVPGIIGIIVTPFLFAGCKVIRPNEALVLTLFGRYIGTLKKDGFFYVNPFSTAVNPAARTKLGQSGDVDSSDKKFVINTGSDVNLEANSKRMSLKVMTLNNSKQKVNDALGNPVEVGVAVMWRIVDTARAAFAVDNYKEYLSLQVDAAVRNIVKIYPYDVARDIDTTGDGLPDEGSLRGSTNVVAERIRESIQEKVQVAGLEILEAKITYLAYATEIASVMLQRQQASAIIDARAMIVDGAVSIVEMALNKLNENNIVELDEERKAAMVSNLLVVLCSNRDTQPVVNSGSLY